MLHTKSTNKHVCQNPTLASSRRRTVTLSSSSNVCVSAAKRALVGGSFDFAWTLRVHVSQMVVPVVVARLRVRGSTGPRPSLHNVYPLASTM